MTIRGRGAFRPEMPAEMKRLERLNGVLAYKIFENVEHYSGVTDAQLATLVDVRPGRLANALDQLNQGEDQEKIAAALTRFHQATKTDEHAERRSIGDLLTEANRGGLLVRIPVYGGPDGELTSNVATVPRREDGTMPPPKFHMNYISADGTIIVEHRDATSLSAIRRRVYEDIRKDHNGYAPQLIHTYQQNDCLAAMSRDGYVVSAGYRGALHLPGGQQLVPDFRLTAFLRLDDSPTEFMLGGHWHQQADQARAEREEIRRQLEQYVPEARRRDSLSVVCLCEDEAVAEVTRNEAVKVARDYNVALHVVAVTTLVDDTAPGRPNHNSPTFPLFRWYVEYERSATRAAAIREKLMPYFRAALRGYNCPLVVICETERAAEIFRQQHQNLQITLGVAFPFITSTYAQVAAGDQFDTCWNWHGQPAEVR